MLARSRDPATEPSFEYSCDYKVCDGTEQVGFDSTVFNE